MSQLPLPCSATRRGLPGEHPVGVGFCVSDPGRHREASQRQQLLESLAQTVKAQADLRARLYVYNTLADSGLPRATQRTIREAFEGKPLDVFALDEAIEDAQAEHAQALREAAERPLCDWAGRALESDLTALAYRHAELCGGRVTERFLRQLGLRAGAGVLERPR
jgi:hypothetical protein